MKSSKAKLPLSFKPLFWSYDFSLINPIRNKQRIIINVVNYGNWEHWQWILKYYGVARVKKLVENIPASEFRQRALKLFRLLLNIKKIKYENRGIKIRAERDI